MLCKLSLISAHHITNHLSHAESKDRNATTLLQISKWKLSKQHLLSTHLNDPYLGNGIFSRNWVDLLYEIENDSIALSLSVLWRSHDLQ